MPPDDDKDPCPCRCRPRADLAARAVLEVARLKDRLDEERAARQRAEETAADLADALSVAGRRLAEALSRLADRRAAADAPAHGPDAKECS